MKIYTKTGDKGETSLFGGKRVWKDDKRISAYGTIDELNAQIGVALTEIQNEELKKAIISIQNKLFIVGADLATPFENNIKITIPRIENFHIEFLENLIDKFDSQLPELKNFILPGGSKGSSQLHYSRTICRRAEREVVNLAKSEEINPNVEIFLNRLSDLFFVFARFENYDSKIADISWVK